MTGAAASSTAAGAVPWTAAAVTSTAAGADPLTAAAVASTAAEATAAAAAATAAAAAAAATAAATAATVQRCCYAAYCEKVATNSVYFLARWAKPKNRYVCKCCRDYLLSKGLVDVFPLPGQP